MSKDQYISGRNTPEFNFPPKLEVTAFTQKLASSIFPVIEGGRCRKLTTEELTSKLIRILEPLSNLLADKPAIIAKNFFAVIPEIEKLLNKDALFITANDPAASGVEEVIMAYPGFFAITVYRLAHQLSKQDVPVIPRVMTEYAHSLTGIDIHPKANIGAEFSIDHGTGVVIGETAVIGNRVKFYQGVTIGALSVNKELALTKRHPTIEDNVIIYSGSTILGGKTTIGHDSIIGGNVWLTESVPPFSLVYHESKVTVRERNNK
jgi:serine O-acetyltransferase